MELMKNFWTDESGQGLTEYAVIIGLVSVALLLVLLAFRDEIARVFNSARNELQTYASPAQAST
jgi:pilus assembly protein Flp/PilA